jgi:putative endonuclease
MAAVAISSRQALDISIPGPPTRGTGMQERRFYVYILTNRWNNVLYTGVTRDLKRRMEEHKAGAGAVFTSKYRTDKLVYIEGYDNPRMAVVREQQITDWRICPVTCERYGGGDGHAPSPSLRSGSGARHDREDEARRVRGLPSMIMARCLKGAQPGLDGQPRGEHTHKRSYY